MASATLALPRPFETPTPTAGTLTWLTAAAVSATAVSTAIATGGGELFWAAAGCTLMAAIFAFRPEAGLILVLLVRPSLDLWADRSVASFAGFRVNSASLTAIVLILLGAAYIAERWSLVRTSPAIYPFLAFAAIAGVGIVGAPAFGVAIYEWLRLVSLLVLYAVCYVVARASGDARRLVVVLLLSTAVPIAVGVYQTAEGGTRFIADFGRATGTFLHPVPFGIFLALIIAFATPLLLSRGLPWRWALWLGVPFAVVALIGSYTRTAWIGAVIGVLLVAASRHRSLLVLAPVLIVLIAVAVPSTVTRTADLSDDPTSLGGSGNSLTARVDQWRLNLAKVERNPVVGQGLGSIVETEQGTRVHSDYLRAAVETGVFGLAAYAWLLTATIASCYRALRRAREAADRFAVSVALGSLAAAVAFVVMSATSNLLTQVVVASAFWAIAAVGHAVAARSPSVVAAR